MRRPVGASLGCASLLGSLLELVLGLFVLRGPVSFDVVQARKVIDGTETEGLLIFDHPAKPTPRENDKAILCIVC